MSHPVTGKRTDDEFFELTLEMFDGWEVIPNTRVVPLDQASIDLFARLEEVQDD